MLNTSWILSLLQFVVYPGTSTRVGSKHIPEMMIPYSPVTELDIGYLFVEVLVQISKYPMSGLHAGVVIALMFLHTWLHAHLLLITIISDSDAYDVFNSASTTEITKTIDLSLLTNTYN